MLKKLLAGATTLALALGMVAVTAGTSSATGTECVPKDAYTETVIDSPAVLAVAAIPEVTELSHIAYQRYSWTGGRTETAPPEGAPSEGWQANTTNYAGAGHNEDPIGKAFSTNDNRDGNWFFWTGTKIIDRAFIAGTPGTPGVPEVTSLVEHPAVTCPPVPPQPKVTTRSIPADTLDCATGTVNTVTANYSTTTTYVYDAESNSYTAVEGAEVQGVNTSSDRKATLEECPVVVPDKPKATVTHTSSTAIACGTMLATTRNSTTTVDYKLVNNAWVEQAPVTVQDPDTTRPATDAEAAECPVVVDPPVQPKSIVTQSLVSTSDCKAKTVTTVDTISTTPFVLNVSETEYVKGTPVTTTATSTREMTDAEAPECGQLTPLAFTGSKTPLAFTGSNGTLAFTGSNGTLAGGLLLGLVFVLFGAGVITVTRVTRRNS